MTTKELDRINTDVMEAADVVKGLLLNTARASQAAEEIVGGHGLGCELQIRNLKKSCSSLHTYMGICDMLLDHIKDDLIVIYKAQKECLIRKTERNEKLYEQVQREKAKEKQPDIEEPAEQ